MNAAFKQNRLNAPLRWKHGLRDLPGVEVEITVARNKLPTEAAEFPRWAAILAGALGWCLMYPPKPRRGKVIQHLNRPPATWVAKDKASALRKIAKASKGKATLDLACDLPVLSDPNEIWKAVLDAEIGALHNRLPVKLTVVLGPSGAKVEIHDLVSVLHDFASRLVGHFTYYAHYAKHRPGGATPDQPLSFWIGLTAAMAHQIVTGKKTLDDALVFQFESIKREVAGIEGYRKIKYKKHRDRFLVACIVERAFRGAPGSRRFKTLSQATRRKIDLDHVTNQVDSFHNTFVKPYTGRLLKDAPLRFSSSLEVLLPLLLGPPGALAEHLGFKPKSAF